MTGNKGRVGAILQARDRRIFGDLAKLGVIDREMSRLSGPFGSATQVKLRLLELTRAKFLSRSFVGTISGGRKAVYRLAPKGAAAIGFQSRPVARKRGGYVRSDMFLDHQLQTNALLLRAKYQPIPVSGATFREFQTFSEPLSKMIPLIPDAYLEVETASGIRAMFLEVDLGTEPLRIWEQKVRRYLHLAASGEFPKLFHQAQFRVLVVTDSERRLSTIQSVVGRSTDKIFWFATFDRINRDGLWSSVWLRPVGDQRLSLL
jgi:hypothetical protein